MKNANSVLFLFCGDYFVLLKWYNRNKTCKGWFYLVGNGDVFKVSIGSLSNVVKMSGSESVDDYVVLTVKEVIRDCIKREEINLYDNLYRDLKMSSDQVDQVIDVLINDKGFDGDWYNSYLVQSVSDIILLIK